MSNDKHLPMPSLPPEVAEWIKNLSEAEATRGRTGIDPSQIAKDGNPKLGKWLLHQMFEFGENRLADWQMSLMRMAKIPPMHGTAALLPKQRRITPAFAPERELDTPEDAFTAVKNFIEHNKRFPYPEDGDGNAWRRLNRIRSTWILKFLKGNELEEFKTRVQSMIAKVTIIKMKAEADVIHEKACILRDGVEYWKVPELPQDLRIQFIETFNAKDRNPYALLAIETAGIGYKDGKVIALDNVSVYRARIRQLKIFHEKEAEIKIPISGYPGLQEWIEIVIRSFPSLPPTLRKELNLAGISPSVSESIEAFRGCYTNDISLLNSLRNNEDVLHVGDLGITVERAKMLCENGHIKEETVLLEANTLKCIAGMLSGLFKLHRMIKPPSLIVTGGEEVMQACLKMKFTIDKPSIKKENINYKR